MNRARIGAFCACVAVTSVFWAGCGLVPAFVPPDLPADMQFVVDNSAALTRPAGEQADPNATPVQSAADLSGCWGRAYEPVETETPAQGASLTGQSHVTAQLFEVWHFDAASQAVRYEMLILDVNTGASTLQIMSGTFTMPAPGSVTIQLTKFETNNWATGAIEEVPWTDPNTQPPASTNAVEQSGGRLYFLEEGKTVATSDPNDVWTLQRFDCPG
jgi:hypothetical protein